MTSSMIGGLISSEVRNKALTSVSEVVCDFKDYYGTKVSYRRAWMGVEKTRDVVFGDYSSSFDDLRWYVDTTNDCNLGSVFDMEFDIDSKGRHFKCLFFAFEACIHGFKYCRPVLMLDKTFLKGRHKGYLLAATEKDSNQGLYPLCFSIVDSERYDNWHWFLSKLFVILTPGRDITVANLKSICSLLLVDVHMLLLLSCLMSYLKNYRCGHNVQKFLEDLPNECWCNAYFQGKRHGEMCTNAVESFNSWIRDKHHLFSTNLVDAMRVKLMEQFSKEKKLEEAFNDTKTWIVKKCSDDIHEI
ncbi:hypothetical protein ACSBR2_025776 [Camellia fascicularis]